MNLLNLITGTIVVHILYLYYIVELVKPTALKILKVSYCTFIFEWKVIVLSNIFIKVSNVVSEMLQWVHSHNQNIITPLQKKNTQKHGLTFY